MVLILDTIAVVERTPPKSLKVMIRPFSANDCMAALTQLLHRAYAPLADRGMRYLASYQDEAMTRTRVNEGECYVAVDDTGSVIATVTLMPPGVPHYEGCDYYRKSGVARFGQFAVEPTRQGCGIGSMLMEHIEHRAAEFGATELACDTSENASHLIAMYIKRGYSLIGAADWDVTNYRSVILSKPLTVSP